MLAVKGQMHEKMDIAGLAPFDLPGRHAVRL